ncbi:MAG TPA: STAS-like domain-containing protein [Solirubrobacteraceae bacterium]|jgi:hypothetical protein|nr:STAS-like domain-containing protein [Solirubrobacteraceae bacterium]
MTTTALASNENIQTIHLSELGPDLSGRTRGETIRGLVEPGVTEVVFDCTGVESMSPSFADEVFGKLAAQPQRPHIKIINASQDILALARFAVSERLS